MAKWVVKTASDYARALHGIQDSATRLSKRLVGISADTLLHLAVEIMGRAMELAPLDTGHLRASAYVMVSINGSMAAYYTGDGGNAALDISAVPGDAIDAYIGFSASYAFTQHEHIEFHHENGQAKFLEAAFKSMTPELIERIKAAAEVI